MTNRTLLSLACVLAAACAEYSGESVSPAEQAAAPAEVSAPVSSTTPTDKPGGPGDSTAATSAKAPSRPAPERIFVAAEGRCQHLGVSIVAGKPLAYYQDQAIVELGPDGAPTGVTIDTALPRDPKSALLWVEHLPRIERLGGRSQAELYAEVTQYPREGVPGVYRRTENGWQNVRPLGDADIERMWPWYDGSLLAFAPWAGDKGARFGVVRGKPKGPRFDDARAKTGCKEANVRNVLVLERGDVVALWTCDRPSLFVTHWSGGDLAGHTRDLGLDTIDTSREGVEVQKIATDGRDSFYITATATDEDDRLWRGKHADWEPIALPPGAGITSIATDPKGQLWIAGKKIARRAGDQWIEITNPAGVAVDELAGVEHGTPWVRTGNRLWRIANDTATEISVPPSAFFEGETLSIDSLHFAGPDDVWAEANFVVQRRGKGGPGRYYRSLLHSLPTEHPLRCGEMTDGVGMNQPYVRWPTAAGGACETRMVLLLRRKHWDDDNEYDKVRRAVKKIGGVETVRFAEVELGAEKFLAAITPDPAIIATLTAKTKKLRPYAYPEVVCGDQTVLDAAGVVVHRELDLAPPGKSGETP